MKYFPTETETGEKGNGQKYGLKQKWEKRGVKEMKNQTMYISMLLWLHTYFSLNSVFIVCSIYIQGGPNIVFDMKMRNVLI